MVVEVLLCRTGGLASIGRSNYNCAVEDSETAVLLCLCESFINVPDVAGRGIVGINFNQTTGFRVLLMDSRVLVAWMLVWEDSVGRGGSWYIIAGNNIVCM